MHIKRLKIDNFRNIKQASLDFSSKVNVLAGNNAQGKTNTLESIYLSLTGRSYRENITKNFIGPCSSEAAVNLDILSEEPSEYSLSLQIYEEKKEFRLDNEPVGSRARLMRLFPVILFAPEDLKIVKGPPKERRDYLDDALIYISVNYGRLLSDYKKLIAEKTSLLKNYSAQTKNMLDIYDEQLSEIGSSILKQRIKFLKELKDKLKQLYSSISAQNETLELTYISELFKEKIEGDIKSAYLQMLHRSRSQDVIFQNCGSGAHRDDFSLLLDGRNARKFASQGQQRSLSLCLKLALVDIFKDKREILPVVLLDDVMSELDEHRRSKIMDLVSEVQTILTLTDRGLLPGEFDLKLFTVSQGVIK